MIENNQCFSLRQLLQHVIGKKMTSHFRFYEDDDWIFCGCEDGALVVISDNKRRIAREGKESCDLFSINAECFAHSGAVNLKLHHDEKKRNYFISTGMAPEDVGVEKTWRWSGGVLHLHHTAIASTVSTLIPHPPFQEKNDGKSRRSPRMTAAVSLPKMKSVNLLQIDVNDVATFDEDSSTFPARFKPPKRRVPIATLPILSTVASENEKEQAQQEMFHHLHGLLGMSLFANGKVRKDNAKSNLTAFMGNVEVWTNWIVLPNILTKATDQHLKLMAGRHGSNTAGDDNCWRTCRIRRTTMQMRLSQWSQLAELQQEQKNKSSAAQFLRRTVGTWPPPSRR